MSVGGFSRVCLRRGWRLGSAGGLGFFSGSVSRGTPSGKVSFTVSTRGAAGRQRGSTPAAGRRPTAAVSHRGARDSDAVIPVVRTSALSGAKGRTTSGGAIAAGVSSRGTVLTARPRP